MENKEKIQDIFEKTSKILYPVWNGYENEQMSHVLYYLSLTAGYLKNKEEAETFKKNWNVIKEYIENGSDKQDWLNQSHMINSHLEQALKEESVQNPKDNRNPGIGPFYENKFPSLYTEAKKAYDDFQKSQDEMVAAIQKHHEDVFL